MLISDSIHRVDARSLQSTVLPFDFPGNAQLIIDAPYAEIFTDTSQNLDVSAKNVESAKTSKKIIGELAKLRSFLIFYEGLK